MAKKKAGKAQKKKAALKNKAIRTIKSLELGAKKAGLAAARAKKALRARRSAWPPCARQRRFLSIERPARSGLRAFLFGGPGPC